MYSTKNIIIFFKLNCVSLMLKIIIQHFRKVLVSLFSFERIMCYIFIFRDTWYVKQVPYAFRSWTGRPVVIIPLMIAKISRGAPSWEMMPDCILHFRIKKTVKQRNKESLKKRINILFKIHNFLIFFKIRLFSKVLLFKVFFFFLCNKKM